MKTRTAKNPVSKQFRNSISPVHMYFGLGRVGGEGGSIFKIGPRKRDFWAQGYGQACSHQAQPNAKAHSARNLPSRRPSGGRGGSSPQPRLLPAEGVGRISAGPGDPAKPHLCVSDLLARLRSCPASCFAHELSPLTSLAHLPWGHWAFPSLF